jgi:hypothetical protein
MFTRETHRIKAADIHVVRNGVGEAEETGVNHTFGKTEVNDRGL